MLKLKNRKLQLETWTSEEELYTFQMTYSQLIEKRDVYSFAMTCYEIITGRMPFEDHDVQDFDIILRGERPTLPNGPHSMYNDLIRDCWHKDFRKRPYFSFIVSWLERRNYLGQPSCDFRKRA